MRAAAGLRRTLLAWYRRHRRALPWRATRDPYRIWVSEVMLQQTRVAVATPYYERFVAQFPDVTALARARIERVLAAWSGLGYYRRARHLHAAAGIVVREHAGSIPSDPRAFGALPGVGRYTVGAVLSMGFGSRLAVLDGNVARVLSRLTARPLAVKRPADARALWEIAESLLPGGGRPARPGRKADEDPGDWNQALMELGATVCTPRAPSCTACPVRPHCKAHALREVDSYPPVLSRRAPARLRRAIALLQLRGRTLVVRRRGALLDGLWEPPGVDLLPGHSAGRELVRALAGLGIRARLADTGARTRHSITHRAITVELWRALPIGGPPQLPRLARWASPGGHRLALTALARRVIGAVGEAHPTASTVRAGMRSNARRTSGRNA